MLKAKEIDGVKTEHGEIIDGVHHKYIGDKYKNLNLNTFKYGLMNGVLHLKNLENRHVDLTNIVNKYLEEKY